MLISLLLVKLLVLKEVASKGLRDAATSSMMAATDTATSDKVIFNSGA
ncbi:hypothetical protein [Agrobacterium rosae]|uniref:Uncharacterized protein n=1 Tax=Agrobacterium rosae TaxID=1972867 RepID=A0AAW9FFY6_9HYPH|nr:hypothetical protein [Agrobacterium rosae]MDX8304461.1 hypothetical protein [Agrobacterium rosae]